MSERRSERSAREVVIKGLPKSEWTTLFQDHGGRIWIAGAGGVGYVENGRFVSIGGTRGGIVYGVAEDAARDIWIANLDHGLVQLSGGRVVRHIPWSGLGHTALGMSLAADPLQGGLWLGFYQGGVAYWKDGQVRAPTPPPVALAKARLATCASMPMERCGPQQRAGSAG